MQTLSSDVQKLAPPGHGLDLQAVQRGQRWIVGLERAESDKINAIERTPDALFGEKPRERPGDRVQPADGREALLELLEELRRLGRALRPQGEHATRVQQPQR